MYYLSVRRSFLSLTLLPGFKKKKRNESKDKEEWKQHGGHAAVNRENKETTG